MKEAARPASCDECTCFAHTPDHKPETGNCLRRAPGTTDREKTIAYWPNVRRSSRCGQGFAIGDGSGPGVVRCGTCLFWWPPADGEGIKPEGGRFGKSVEWWAETGLCIPVAPHPTGQPPQRPTEWFVTHARGGCGDGVEIPPIEPAA